MLGYLRLIAVALLVAQTGAAAIGQTTDELAGCVAFLRQNVTRAAEANVGSGFLVQVNDTPFLVTAAHVARAVGADWTLVLQGGDGKPATVRMQNAAWKFSANHDVAVLLLNVVENQKSFVLGRSLPVKVLSSRDLPPSRDITLTVMGFPLGVGVEGYVSPLSLETKAASGFITLHRFDTKTPATFILLQHPSIGGLSGGPVFDTGLPNFGVGRQIVVRQGLSVVGLIHGELTDRKVGKLTAVVPSSEITPLLQSSEMKR